MKQEFNQNGDDYMIWIVIMVQSFDSETPCYYFDTEKAAQDYMQTMWEDYYNTELAEGSDLDEALCYHEDDYAKVTFSDGDKVEFIVTWAVKR